MEFKAKDIAALLNGTIEGDGEATVNNVSKIEEGKPDTLAFLSNPKYESHIYTTQASVVLVNNDFHPTAPIAATLIRVPSAYEAMAKLLQLYDAARPQPTGIEQPSFVGEGTQIGESPYIGAFAYIGKGVKIGHHVKIHPHAFIGDNVEIGDHSTIHAGVKIYYGSKIGKSCIIHAGSVIGADGFGFAPSDAGYNKVPQIGVVVLEDNVEIGANTCIDRAMMGATCIREGVKLDNLIQIGHNVVIGKNTVIAAQSGIAGSAKVGERCMFGGQVGIVGHIEIADGVKIGAQAGVGNSIKSETAYIGSPAFDAAKFYKAYVLFRKLPEMAAQLQQLEKELKAINRPE